MVVNNKFQFGDLVYIKTDKEQNTYIVIAFFVTGKELKYLCACGDKDKYFFEIELSSEKNILMATTN